MADLDTRDKRGSGIGVDSPYLRVYPNPDGAINQADRQQTALKYSGILASGPIVTASGSFFLLMN